MSAASPHVLAEHAGLLFVSKPAGIPTEPDAKHSDSLLARVAAQLGLARERLHAHSRLDIGVSGVVTLSVSSAARRRVVDLRERGLWRRRYLALAAGQAAEPRGVWRESIGRARGSRRAPHGAHARPAETHFAAVASASFPAGGAPVTLLALEPRSGRTHQLRVHASAHGLPLLGDRGYGGPPRFARSDGSVLALERVALHAAWVELDEGPAKLRVDAPLPDDLHELWSALGGDPVAWQQASAQALG